MSKTNKAAKPRGGIKTFTLVQNPKPTRKDGGFSKRKKKIFLSSLSPHDGDVFLSVVDFIQKFFPGGVIEHKLIVGDER